MRPRRFLLYLWPFRAPARVTFYASGGPISSNSGRNGEKNAAKNPWFLDFLPPLPVCTESSKMLNRFASLRAAAFALKCAVAHFYILRCQRQRGSSHFNSTFRAVSTLSHPRGTRPAQHNARNAGGFSNRRFERRFCPLLPPRAKVGRAGARNIPRQQARKNHRGGVRARRPTSGSSRTPTPTRSPVTRRDTLAPPYKRMR